MIIRADVKRLILYFVGAIIIAMIAVIIVTINFTIQNRDADKKMEEFTETFVNDLIHQDYDKILEYTYKSSGKNISEEDFKELLLEYEDTSEILQLDKGALSYYNAGDIDVRTITIAGRDSNDNFYMSEFDVKKIDGKFWLYFKELSDE